VDYADIFLQIFKKYCRDYEVATFSNFCHFSYLLLLFLICKYSRPRTRANTADQKQVDLQTFY